MSQRVNLLLKQIIAQIKKGDLDGFTIYWDQLVNKEKLSAKEVVTLFTSFDSDGSTIIFLAATRSIKYLKIILNSQILADLESQKIFDLLTHTDKMNNAILCFSVKNGAEYIKEILDSKSYQALSQEDTFKLLDTKCNNDNSFLHLLTSKGQEEIISAFEHPSLIEKLSEENKVQLLNNSNLFKGKFSKDILKIILESGLIRSIK